MYRTYVFCTNDMYFATKGGIKVKSEEIVQKFNSAHLSYMYIFTHKLEKSYACLIFHVTVCPILHS